MSDKIAVFIDGDNVSYKNVPFIMDEIKNYGRILIMNFFHIEWAGIH